MFGRNFKYLLGILETAMLRFPMFLFNASLLLGARSVDGHNTLLGGGWSGNFADSAVLKPSLHE